MQLGIIVPFYTSIGPPRDQKVVKFPLYYCMASSLLDRGSGASAMTPLHSCTLLLLHEVLCRQSHAVEMFLLQEGGSKIFPRAPFWPAGAPWRGSTAAIFPFEVGLNCV